MAISTFKVFLMKGTTSGDSTTYSKLVDVKDFPDLGGDPEMLETTTLSDKMQTFIKGIQSGEALKFTANYDKSDYQTLKAEEASAGKYAVWFGGTEDQDGTITPLGDQGKFSFDGELSVHPVGGGVNEVIDMAITIAPSTPISFSVS